MEVEQRHKDLVTLLNNRVGAVNEAMEMCNTAGLNVIAEVQHYRFLIIAAGLPIDPFEELDEYWTEEPQ